jgi:hypothetical protein
VTDHRHEIYDIYGTAATSGDVEHLKSTVDGLREDLGRAESRISDLEEQVGQLLRERAS